MEDAPFLAPEHLAFRDEVREFAQSVIAPVTRELDRDARFPWDSVKAMAAQGLFGVPWPESLGGRGRDYLSYILTIHELAKVDASHAVMVSTHTALATAPILTFGTDAQRATYVPRLAQGRVLGGFALTEPEAGSDAGGTKTTAVRRGDDYVINGTKRFITHAGVGEIFLVTARSDPSAVRTHGITAFL